MPSSLLQVVNSLFQTCYNNWEHKCEHNGRQIVNRFVTTCLQICNSPCKLFSFYILPCFISCDNWENSGMSEYGNGMENKTENFITIFVCSTSSQTCLDDSWILYIFLITLIIDTFLSGNKKPVDVQVWSSDSLNTHTHI